MDAPPDRPRRTAPSPLVVAIAALAVAVLAIVVVALIAFRGVGGADAAATPAPTPSPTRSAPTVPEVFDTVGPSVVVVRTADGALGSGVVVAKDGSILTANHVVEDGSAITVTFADGTDAPATIASADPATDIATLAPGGLPGVLVPATLGGSVDVGASVVAIGNPLGLAYSVSTGVVSGLDRTATTAEGRYAGLIQFDASVNPGSSGGPLLDADGDVVGVVVSIADPGHDDAFAGIAFAVPVGAALGSGGATPQI